MSTIRTNRIENLDGSFGIDVPNISASLKTVIPISNVPALLGTSTTNLGEDNLFLLRSYHVDFEIGGGLFYYDSTRPKSDHNGGTVISPTVPWDGSQIALGSFLAGTGETNPLGTGCWVRIVEELLTPEIFGAKATVGVDDRPAFQAAIDESISVSKSLYLTGMYSISDTLIYDITSESAPNDGRSKPSILGAGQGVAGIQITSDNTLGLQIEGSMTGTGASHSYQTFEGFFIGGASPTSRTTVGIQTRGIAFAEFSNLGFHNLDVCMSANSTLSTQFYSCDFNESNIGFSAAVAGGFSGFNAIAFNGCRFASLSTRAIDTYDRAAGVSLKDCQVEGCGTQAVSGTGGVFVRTNGNDGRMTLTVTDTYFEGNAGEFDLYVANSSLTPTIVNIEANNFNRASGTRFVTNNVKVEGTLLVVAKGNSFAQFNDYVASSGRKNFNLVGSVELVDLGNFYQSRLESPATTRIVPYSGKYDTGGGSTFLPTDWSLSVPSTGIYSITHNLGHPDYSVVATSNSGSIVHVERVSISNNSFDVVIKDGAGSPANGSFSFSVTEFVAGS